MEQAYYEPPRALLQATPGYSILLSGRLLRQPLFHQGDDLPGVADGFHGLGCFFWTLAILDHYSLFGQGQPVGQDGRVGLLQVSKYLVVGEEGVVQPQRDYPFGRQDAPHSCRRRRLPSAVARSPGRSSRATMP